MASCFIWGISLGWDLWTFRDGSVLPPSCQSPSRLWIRETTVNRLSMYYIFSFLEEISQAKNELGAKGLSADWFLHNFGIQHIHSLRPQTQRQTGHITNYIISNRMATSSTILLETDSRRFHVPSTLSAVLYTGTSHMLSCRSTFCVWFLVVHARPRFEENAEWT